MRRILPFAVVLTAFAALWLALPKRDLTQRADTNLVLIITCTVRADQTSLGTGLKTTPTLARWASEGTHFSELIATAPWTRAASTALLTGRTASDLAIAEPAPGMNDRALPLAATTLAEALSEAGWTTLGATANPNLNASFQFDQGFDRYEGLSGLWRSGLAKVPGTEVVRTALQLVDAAPSSKPTFLQLVFVDAHAPNDASKRETAAFAEDGLPDHVAAYRAQLHRLDGQLASLEEELKTRGFTTQNTVFAVVADHGEGLRTPDHHGMGHGLYLYPSTVHVPFVVKGPGVPEATVVNGIASGTDVAPTLAELVGVSFPQAAEADAKTVGKSLVPVLRGATPREQAYTATWFRSAHRASIYTRETACQRDYTPDLPAHPKQEKPHFPSACFDRADAGFSSPAPPQPELQGLLDEWFRQQEAHIAASRTERGAVDGDLKAALKALGYATEDDDSSSSVVDPEKSP
ncbi:MAG: sulfatase [Proteobacteria bacterium]|nr:sulfatase [Pseudomonadota bacterium]